MLHYYMTLNKKSVLFWSQKYFYRIYRLNLHGIKLINTIT